MDAQESGTPRPAVRSVSIDVFRGFVIACMLLVNSIRGREFAPETFRHADWRVGPLHASFADMVAPWFLLAVGLSLPFSMHSGRGRGMSFTRKMLVAGKRSAILFAIGGLIEAARIAYHDPITWRTLISVDVLPQIAVAYFITVALYHGPKWLRPAFIVLVFLSKWVLLAHWPYPGVGHAMWTPEQNMQDFLRARFPMFKGLHGAMVGACIVSIGTYLGDRLRNAGPPTRDAFAFIGAGALMVAIGWLWSFDLPFNRYYHTPTWALLAAGTGSMILGVCHGLCARGPWLWLFEPWGRNPIAIYILAELLWPMVLLSWLVKGPGGVTENLWTALERAIAHFIGAAAAPWVQVSLYLAVFWLIAWVMYRRRVILRL